MEFFNKVRKKDERVVRIQKEINGVHIRKASVLSVIQNELDELERQKKEVFYNAGKKAYDDWNENREDMQELTGFWSQIQEIEDSMAEKQDKRIEMEERYNEEIALLQKGLEQGEIVTQVENTDKSHCPFCGAEINSSDKFCEKCGKKLQ